MTPDLSIIIPAFNEEKRIGKTLTELFQYLDHFPGQWELIIVDDGSRDRTVEVAKSAGPCRVLSHAECRGKGAALRTGMLASQGKFAMFMDADLSVPMAEFPRFWQALQADVDVLIGTRRVRGSAVTQHQPWLRETLGRGFTALSNFILGTEFSDLTCGFKFFRGQAAREIFAAMRVDDWSFDAEILYLAHRKKLRIVELPLTWHNDPNTKVRLWKDVARSLWGLIKIRCLHF